MVLFRIHRAKKHITDLNCALKISHDQLNATVRKVHLSYHTTNNSLFLKGPAKFLNLHSKREV